MAEVATAGGTSSFPAAEKALKAAAALWFIIAAAGQWIFVYYVVAVYGGAALSGDIAAWSDTSLRGYAAGDTAGNLVFGSHVLMAAILTLGGTLQLVPQVRARLPALHRWNGRLFLGTAVLASLGGLYLVWVRGVLTTVAGGVAITLNAILILAFSALALRRALARDFQAHRRWALRAFIVANGVWFFRVGMMAWVVLNRGPVGMTRNLDGPFDLVWAFGNFLLPLAILELYLLAQARGGPTARYAMAGGLALAAVITGVGTFGAATLMWGPRL